MKIQTILSENFNAMAQAQGIKFSDLNTLQVRTLQRIANGEVDVETAEEREYDIMADLAEMGLLDQEYAMTERGMKAVAIAKKLGGSSELLAAKRRGEKMGAPNADNPELPPVEGEDDVAGMGGEEDEFSFDMENGGVEDIDAGKSRNKFSF